MYTASAGSSVSETNMKTLFSKYSTSSGIIDGEGVEKFFEDIKVDMMDPVTLVIMHSMGVQESGKIEQKMFKKGCEQFKADTPQKWASIVPDLKKDLAKNAKLNREVYDFAFLFSLVPGIKVLDKEIAIILWPILLKCKFLDIWIQFIESLDRKIVKKDEWQMFYTLVQQTGGDFANYVDDGCWPTLFDDFVEFYGKHKK